MSRAFLLAILAGCSEYGVNPKDPEPSDPTTEDPAAVTLALSPETADLGVVALGETVTQTLVLTAAGGEVTLGTVSVAGAGFTLLDAPSGAALADGESLDFDAVFVGTAEGGARGEVTVLSDADTGDVLVSILDARVEAPGAPDITVDPPTLTIADGTSELVTVGSVGELDLAVSDVTVTGEGFSLVDGGGLPGTLGVGFEADIEVAYAGRGGEGLLEIRSDDPDEPVVTVPLVGTHVGGCEDIDADADGSNSCDDCDDADPGRAPHLSEICDDGIDQDCDGLDAADIVLGLLPGWGSGSRDANLIWPDFVATWGSYGTCPVTLVDIAPGFDLATLTGAGATALVLTDPAGDSVVYDAGEQAAIRAFAEGGHGGLIATYILSWNGWSHTESYDNSALADLFGVEPTLLSMNHAESVDTVVALTDAAHPVCDGLSSRFTLSPYEYAQGRTAATWADALLPGADVVMEADDGHMATLVYEGAAWRAVWFTGMADYQTGAPQAMYNAALWTAAR